MCVLDKTLKGIRGMPKTYNRKVLRALVPKTKYLNVIFNVLTKTIV